MWTLQLLISIINDQPGRIQDPTKHRESSAPPRPNPSLHRARPNLIEVLRKALPKISAESTECRDGELQLSGDDGPTEAHELFEKLAVLDDCRMSAAAACEHLRHIQSQPLIQHQARWHAYNGAIWSYAHRVNEENQNGTR